ncbi:M16 family metallopeptidase [Roseivirga sp. BDSF3-8]|uniref:M16 family metallopeptidase n=1 Tax=Roseivirga sp. BDSF3-8 TaxID=3241598 RepID=UPI003531F871
MKKLGYLVMCLLVTIAAQAQDQKEIDFVEYDLDNGLHVILHQDNSTPIVAVTMMYHVGSKNEDPQRTGFAHFFEHLLFEGSKNIDRGEYAKIVERAGGQWNANTSQDRTFYYEVLPSNRLELGLYLESERLLHAKIDSTGVETQREVVKEEKRQRYDNQPYMTFAQEIFKRAYTEHPYRWTPIGSMEDLDAATMEEFMDFYKKFYVPNNAVLSIAGDLDIDDTRELVEKYFSEIPRGTMEIPRPDVVEPAQAEEIRDVIYDDIQLPAVFHAYHMPAQGTDDYYALSMLTQVLSGGPSARLNKQLVDKQQKALQVFAFPYALENPGLFITLGITNIGITPEELESAIDAEFESVQEELITEREFQKIRNQIEVDFVSQNSRVAGVAESLADYHMYFGDANLINTEIEKFMDVTREDLKRVANKYLTKENRVVLYYLPKSENNQTQSN